MIVKRPLVINQPQIGKLIRELRLETGLTQEQFAAFLGVTYSTMNRWENGRSKPSPLAMQKIEELLRQRQMGDRANGAFAEYARSELPKALAQLLKGDRGQDLLRARAAES